MKKAAVLVVLALGAGLTSGCHHYPPRFNLESMGAIGIVDFRTEAKGVLAEYATRLFIEVLVQSQPGVRIKELGTEADVLRDIGQNRLGPDALAALRSRYAVDAVFLGTLDVSKVTPRIDVLAIISTLSVSADVDAQMTARLVDTGDGTTIWADSARDRQTVANVSVHRGGGVFFDARDPERAYGSLMRDLVGRITRDFQWR